MCGRWEKGEVASPDSQREAGAAWPPGGVTITPGAQHLLQQLTNQMESFLPPRAVVLNQGVMAPWDSLRSFEGCWGGHTMLALLHVQT